MMEQELRVRLRSLPAVAFLLLAACGGGETSAPKSPAEQGRIEFRACAVCHSVTDPAAPGAAPLIGPSLYEIYGARSARLAEFDYSPALLNASLVWDAQTLDEFLARPQAVVPGTRMAYAGEPSADKRAAIIAYLKTLK